jgi:outer membrane protein OmpU
MDIDSGANGTSANLGGGDPEIFITGAFGTIMIGNITHAADAIGLAEVGDGAGADDTLESLRGTVAADVSWKYTIEGLTLTLSTEVGGTADSVSTGEGDFSMHASYTMGGLTAELGFADINSSGDTWTGFELGYKMGAATLGATFINTDYGNAATRDRSGAGFSIGYAVNDALTVTGVMSSTDGVAAGATSIDDYGVGFAYNLGGGATIVGGMAEENTVDAWDLGIQMKF